MTEAIASALIVTAPSILTNDQVDHVRAGIVRQLPAGAVVLVIPPGFTVQQLGAAPTSVDSLRSVAGDIAKQLEALVSLQKSATNISNAVDELRGAACIRVAV